MTTGGPGLVAVGASGGSENGDAFVLNATFNDS